MNNYKQLGKNKKRELPSFLVGLTDAPEDITFNPKPHPSTHYLGPIFVGLCTNFQHHAPPHSLKLGSFHQPQYIMLPGADDISKLLYPQTKVEKPTQKAKHYKYYPKRPMIFHDPYPHKSPGVNKLYVPEVTPHVINLGKTRSIIEGEASIEVPLARSHKMHPRFKRKSISKHENDFITLSDLREERRMFMSYKERIAHAHFPKEFTTVRVIGPPIPASITVTKLPSKRKTESQLNLELKSEAERAGSRVDRRRSTKSRSASVSSKKRMSRKSVGQHYEDVEKPEEETEAHNEALDESYIKAVEEAGDEKEEEEKEENEEEGKEENEEDEIEEEIKTEEPEEKEESKIEIKEAKSEVKQAKSDVKQAKSDVKATKSEVKEAKSDVKATKSEVKEAKSDVKATKSEVKEVTKPEVKEETKTEIKEERVKVVHIKEEETVIPQDVGETGEHEGNEKNNE